MEDKIAKYIGEIRKIEGVSEKTIELVKQLDKENKAGNIKATTRKSNVEVLRMFLNTVKKPLEDIGPDDIINFFAAAEGRYKPSTINTFRAILGKFYRWEGKGQLPERLLPVKKFFATSKKISTIPKILLDPQDIQKLMEAATNPRDKLLPVFLYESGARIGEALNVRLEDITFDQYGAKVILEGKTGERTVRLIDAAPALREWINSHPRRNDGDASLFINGSGKAYTNQYAIALLRKLAKRAGVSKAINPHAFRHARATALTSELKEYEMKAYMGWTMGSAMANTYIHKSGIDVDSKLLANRGLIDANHNGGVKKEIPKTVCPACGKDNTFGNRFCYSCGQGLDQDSTERYKDSEFGRPLRQLLIKEGIKNESDFMKVMNEMLHKAKGATG